jgi:AraC-like DNA-binding protein
MHDYSSVSRPQPRRGNPDGLDEPSADPLSEILLDLRLSGGSYGRCELTRPWGLDFVPQQLARFHFVATGECWLRAASAGWVQLHEGDVVLLPHGTGHALAHAARGKTRPLESVPFEEIGERTYRLRAGGAGARTLLACCSVGFDGPSAHPLVELMPPLLLVRDGATQDPVLSMLLDAMADEVRRQRIGAATVMTRLADVVITRVVRAWVETKREDTTGWLAAVRDPDIGRALAAIHRRPGDPWSVESLADVAHISRSVFAERFSSLVGVSPARYLARHRVHLASMWLKNDGVTVAEAARRVGYDSEASFSRAFKRFVGTPPSALRRLGRGDTPHGNRVPASESVER